MWTCSPSAISAKRDSGLVFSPQISMPSRPIVGLRHAQAARVAVGPDQLLVEGRHQLAVQVEDRAVRPDQHVGVPEAADAGIGALGEAERDMYAVRCAPRRARGRSPGRRPAAPRVASARKKSWL